MTYHVPFSTFQQPFPRTFSRERVVSLYIDSLLAVLAKDPSYRWASKTELSISCRCEDSSRAFSLGQITRKAVFQFGVLINKSEVLGW